MPNWLVVLTALHGTAEIHSDLARWQLLMSNPIYFIYIYIYLQLQRLEILWLEAKRGEWKDIRFYIIADNPHSLCIFAYTSVSGCFQLLSLSDFLLFFVFIVFNGITSNTDVLCCIALFPVLLLKIPGESHANYKSFPNCTQYVFVNIRDGQLLKLTWQAPSGHTTYSQTL